MSAMEFRILAVDDQAPILKFLKSALSGPACVVSGASTAEQALALIAREPFDLVISDITMPGLSGLDLLRAIKSRQPETPVILITGSPTVDSAVFGLRHGAYDYLAKPFSAPEVRALVDRVREDRARFPRPLSQAAGLAEDLARRQLGLEVFLRIGELALQGMAPQPFVEQVLRDTLQSLAGDAAVMLIRDGEAGFTTHHAGEPALVKQLLSHLRPALDRLVAASGRQTLALTGPGDPYTALAAMIPGLQQPTGVLCLGRNARTRAFLPDEKELLLGFAQNTALALERMRLGQNVERNLVNTITAFVNAIESKDRYLKGHSARVSLYAGEIATVMGLGSENTLLVCRGAILHDLGKLAILDPILSKPGVLTPEEYQLMKDHVEVGYKILKPLGFLDREALAVRHHHERFDGLGYPDGLVGEDIPLIARVVTTADAFDAMTSDRPYRKALPFETAIAEIERGSSTQFDPAAAEAFLAIPRQRLLDISGYSSATRAFEDAVATATGGEAGVAMEAGR
ncbi:MAG: HD domain-containing phosphohydrolase [Candidatus Rokuibacteriota bacterium]